MKKAITKASIKKIIDTYSVRKDEFIQRSDVDKITFTSQLVKSYMITVTPSENGTILVYHSSGNGKRKFIDTWENNKEGLKWCFRNKIDEPLSDFEYIKAMEKDILETEKVKAAARELREQAKREKEEYEAQIDSLKAEIESVKKSKIKSETSTENDTGNTKQGRPKETERMKVEADKIKELMDAGKSNDEIMDILKLKRATFFRLKRLI